MFVLNVKFYVAQITPCVGGQEEGRNFLSAVPLVRSRFLIYLKRYLNALVPEGASLRTRMVASVCIISGTLRCFICLIVKRYLLRGTKHVSLFIGTYGTAEMVPLVPLLIVWLMAFWACVMAYLSGT